jgi:leucyl-tRNA synthetase
MADLRNTSEIQKESLSDDNKLTRELHKTIKKVHEDIESFQFNTAIAAMMTLTNLLQTLSANYMKPTSWNFAYDTLLKLLSPIAPHLSEELWEMVGNEYSIHQQSWPKWEEALLLEDTFTLIVQIDGKVRDRIELSADVSEDDAIAAALSSEKTKLSLNNQKPRNSIYVAKRLINFVTK